MHRIKLAILANTLKHGGIERVVVSLCNALPRDIFDLTLVLRQKSGEYVKDLDSSVRVIELGASSMAACILPMIRVLRREQFDVILSNGVQQNLAIAGLKAIRLVQTRLILVEHNDPFLSRAGTKSWRTSALRSLRRPLYRQADHIVAVSDGVRSSLVDGLGCPAETTSRIYNPVPIRRIMQMAEAACPHPWLESHDLPVFVAVGRIHSQKGFDNLLRAFGQVREQRPSRLILLGNGPQREEIKRQITTSRLSDVVDLPGFDANPYRYMARADAFVLSSRWEGFAIVVAEALACGTRIVAVDCKSGPAEILQDGKYGMLVPPGDEAALAHAMMTVLDKPNCVEQLKSRARDFEVDIAVSQYVRLIQKLCVSSAAMTAAGTTKLDR